MSLQLMSCESLPQKETPIQTQLAGCLSLSHSNFEAENNARQKEL